jgi:UDP-2,3-diacylglucosamine hydrolase
MPQPHPLELPTFWEIRAPTAWASIDFISDLHLAEDTPRTFEAWAEHLLSTPADAVFMLGDLFEVWVGDDARQAGFEARCAEVLAEAAATRTIAFMAGNRDFLVGGDMLKACGVMALPDPTVMIAFGERLMLSHGDALCVADVEYQAFRRQVRSAEWQAAFLARPLADRRETARQIRAQSEQRKTQQAGMPWYDVDSGSAVRWMHEAGTPTLVHGHTHRPGSEPMAPGFIRHVLSDWDLDHGDHGARAEVLRWRRGGLTRVAPSRRDAGATGR